MKLFDFNKKDEQTIKLLKDSRLNFSFDKEATKGRLLNQIAHGEPEQSLVLPRRRVLSYSLSFAMIAVLIAASSTIAYANSSGPGDKLFFLDKLSEKAVIALPMPAPAKAKIEAGVAEERLNELDAIAEKIEKQDAKQALVKTKAIEESQAALTQAIDNISEAQDKLDSKGNTEASKKLNSVLVKLESLADKNKETAEKIKTRLTNEDEKGKLESRIEKIRTAKKKIIDRTERKRIKNLQIEIDKKQTDDAATEDEAQSEIIRLRK